MDDSPDELPREGFLRVDVTGQDPDLWMRLQGKLLQTLEKILEHVVDPDRGLTLREEGQRFTSALLGHCRERLARAGLENEKIEAELHKIYAESEGALAAARKTNAEADALELQTAIQRFKFSLVLAKGLIVSDSSEAVIFRV